MTPDIRSLVESYSAKRAERLKLKKTYDALESQEKELKAQIISHLVAHKLPFFAGSTHVANLKPGVKYAADWPVLYQYIAMNDAFDLLHKRLTDTAIKARKDDGIIIPGITEFDDYDLTLTEIK